MNLRINKKAQEEMVGLVLIMLVVAVIFLVFLGIFMRSSSGNHVSESKDLGNFLEAMFDFTTSCSQDPSAPFKVSELILRCANNPSFPCTPGAEPGSGQEELIKIFREAITSSWNFDKNSPTKYYSLRILREDRETREEKNVLGPGRDLIGGSAPTKTIRQAEKPLPGGVILRLEIHY